MTPDATVDSEPIIAQPAKRKTVIKKESLVAKILHSSLVYQEKVPDGMPSMRIA